EEEHGNVGGGFLDNRQFVRSSRWRSEAGGGSELVGNICRLCATETRDSLPISRICAQHDGVRQVLAAGDGRSRERPGRRRRAGEHNAAGKHTVNGELT